MKFQTPSPRLHTGPGKNATHIAISLPFQYASYEGASRGWIAGTKIFVRYDTAPKAGSEKAGRDAKYFYAVFLENAMPLYIATRTSQ